MAKFEGIHWASHQMRYGLPDKDFSIVPSGSKVYAVSRSVHYALFLAFEGIRFFCRKNAEGRLPSGGKYREYDVDPRPPAGTTRNAERIVVDESTGRAYYTDDHYRTFTEIK